MKWLAVTHESILEADLVSTEVILHNDQFPFSKSDEKDIVKKRCKRETSVWSEGTVPDFAGYTRNDEGI